MTISLWRRVRCPFPAILVDHSAHRPCGGTGYVLEGMVRGERRYRRLPKGWRA